MASATSSTSSTALPRHTGLQLYCWHSQCRWTHRQPTNVTPLSRTCISFAMLAKMQLSTMALHCTTPAAPGFPSQRKPHPVPAKVPHTP